MNKFKTILTVILTLIVTVGAVSAVTMSVDELLELQGKGEQLGAVANPFFYPTPVVMQNTTTGKNALAASTSMNVAFTLTARQVCDNKVIHTTHAALGDASINMTLPATSTLFAACMDQEGAERSFLYCNKSATAASTTQIVAGTGHDLMEPDGQNVEIGGGNCARVTMNRFEKTGLLNVITEVDEMIAAD